MAPGSIPPRPAPAQSNPRSKPRRAQEAIQGASQAKARPRGNPRRSLGLPIYGAVKAPSIEGAVKTPCRAASILDTVREEGNATTLGKVPNPTTLQIFFPVRQDNDVPKKHPGSIRPRPAPFSPQAIQAASQGASKRQSKARPKPRRVQETIQGAAWALPTQGAAKPRRRAQLKAPCRAASILGTVCKEGGPTTLGKVPNPATLGIFFPVRQNDNVPKKGPRLDSPRVRPCALLAPKQCKEARSKRPRDNPRRGPSQGASKRQSKAQPGPFLRKAQPRPVEGAVKGALQGGLYSRHCLQRREPDNVRESSRQR